MTRQATVTIPSTLIMFYYILIIIIILFNDDRRVGPERAPPLGAPPFFFPLCVWELGFVVFWAGCWVSEPGLRIFGLESLIWGIWFVCFAVRSVEREHLVLICVVED